MDKMCVLSLLRGSKKIESLVTNYYTSNLFYSVLQTYTLHCLPYFPTWYHL